MKRRILLCAVTALLFSLQVNAASVNGKIKALIVDGQNNHIVWPKSTVMMKQYLEESGSFNVEVYRYKPLWRVQQHTDYLSIHNSDTQFVVDKPEYDETFSPDFSKYDVVISNIGYNATDWPISTQKSFEQYLQNGGGFVSVHAANNSFPDWDEYNRIVGVSGWGGRNEKHGPHLFYDESGREVRDFSKGDAGQHGNKHEFAITLRHSHPITKGLPPVWMHTKDECYGNLRGPAQNITVLATALCPKEEKGTGLHEPMLMVLNYGQGRIFHTTLGHDDYSFESVGFITTFLRGTEWAATGKVTIPVPADFPSKTTSSARAFIFK
ncbi:ThuA domain-containing protein [Pseudomonadota bacterium]